MAMMPSIVDTHTHHQQQHLFCLFVCLFLGQCEDIQTEPPPRANFADTVNQWIIYDAYTSYEHMKEMQDEMERIKGRKDTELTNMFNIRRLVQHCTCTQG